MAKKVKNLPAVLTSSYAPVVSGSSTNASNIITWSFGTLPTGKIVKYSFLMRRYTSPSGHVITYSGDTWMTVKANYQESWYLAGQPYVTTHTETATVPFDAVDLITGTYEYQLRGTIGTLGNSLTDEPYYSNIFTIIVQ